MNSKKFINISLPNDGAGMGIKITPPGSTFSMTNKIMIAAIVPDSPCDVDGRLKVGDRILEVNDTPTDCLRHSEVRDMLLRSNEPFVSLLIAREHRQFTTDDYFIHPKFLK